jgi:hypothetical protein
MNFEILCYSRYKKHKILEKNKIIKTQIFKFLIPKLVLKVFLN